MMAAEAELGQIGRALQSVGQRVETAFQSRNEVRWYIQTQILSFLAMPGHGCPLHAEYFDANGSKFVMEKYWLDFVHIIDIGVRGRGYLISRITTTHMTQCAAYQTMRAHYHQSEKQNKQRPNKFGAVIQVSSI